MNDERYSIIYSSRTGNTRLLAEAIREAFRRICAIISARTKPVRSNPKSCMLASGRIRGLRMKRRLRF